MSSLNTSPTKSNQTPQKIFLAIGILCFMAAVTPNLAYAKSCKNVHLEVRNKTGKSIKIIDLDYWDSESEKWRSEPVRNEVIKTGLAWQENRNLEHVNKQPVKIRVEYRTLKWNRLFKKWKWSVKKSRYVTRNAKTCTKNSDFIMTLRR